MSRQYSKGINKDSPAYTISAVDLVIHIQNLSAPDRLFWDSRELKKQGAKFQSLPWATWRKVRKGIDGWEFAE